MKKRICLFSIMIVALGACSKSVDNNSNPSNLNSLENKIKGKWFLKSKSDSVYSFNQLNDLTEVYTKFQGTPYIELFSTRSKYAALGGAKAKDALDGGVNLGSLDFGAPIPITSNGFWYYDETSKVVVWGGFNLVPVKATNSELELKFSYGDKSQISYNYTWKFSR
jgi:hypothetical protein